MLFKDVHPENASSPTSVRVPAEIDDKDAHPENAPADIVVILAIDTESIPLQPENALTPMDSTKGMDMAPSRAEHPMNASFPIDVTTERPIVVSEVHPVKELVLTCPIRFPVTVSRDVQP